jgi:predicted permease
MILQFLHVVWPIFAIAGLGWLWQRLGQPFDEKSVSALVTYLGVPSLLLSSLSRTSVRLDVLLQTLLAGGLALLLCAVGGAAVLKLARLPVRPYLPSLIHPNTGNLGLPIVFFALGEPAMPYAIAFSTLVQVSHFTVGIWLASGQLSIRTVLISPPLWSLLAALALIASGTPLPGWVLDVTTLLGGLTVPLMLMLLGGSLTKLKLYGLGRPAWLSCIRVGLGFASGVAVAWGLGLGPLPAGALIIQCAMPVAVFSYLFAVRYGGPSDVVAGMILISTVLALAALPLILRVAA